MFRYISALTVGHFYGARKFFLARAAYASTYVVGMLHMIFIIIILIICRIPTIHVEA